MRRSCPRKPGAETLGFRRSLLATRPHLGSPPRAWRMGRWNWKTELVERKSREMNRNATLWYLAVLLVSSEARTEQVITPKKNGKRPLQPGGEALGSPLLFSPKETFVMVCDGEASEAPLPPASSTGLNSQLGSVTKLFFSKAPTYKGDIQRGFSLEVGKCMFAPCMCTRLACGLGTVGRLHALFHLSLWTRPKYIPEDA